MTRAPLTREALAFIRANAETMTDGMISGHLGWTIAELHACNRTRCMGLTFTAGPLIVPTMARGPAQVAEPAPAPAPVVRHPAPAPAPPAKPKRDVIAGILWDATQAIVTRAGRAVELQGHLTPLFDGLLTVHQAEPDAWVPSAHFHIAKSMVSRRLVELNVALIPVGIKVERKHGTGYRLVDRANRKEMAE